MYLPQGRHYRREGGEEGKFIDRGAVVFEMSAKDLVEMTGRVGSQVVDDESDGKEIVAFRES